MSRLPVALVRDVGGVTNCARDDIGRSADSRIEDVLLKKAMLTEEWQRNVAGS